MFFFSSRRRHTRCSRDWSSDVCSSDLEGTYDGGREKAPAAICRKVANTPEHEVIEIWGDGEQTRSFLYIDECIEGVRRMRSEERRVGKECRSRWSWHH